MQLVVRTATTGYTFQLYTYEPNFDGQESTEKEGDTPVYRYALIEDQHMSLLGRAARDSVLFCTLQTLVHFVLIFLV
jgi:hypothetical protein